MAGKEVAQHGAVEFPTGKLTRRQRRLGLEHTVELFQVVRYASSRELFPAPIDVARYEKSAEQGDARTLLIGCGLGLPAMMGTMTSEMVIGPTGFVLAGVLAVGVTGWSFMRGANWRGGFLRRNIGPIVGPIFERWARERYGIDLTADLSLLRFICTRQEANASMTFTDDNGQAYRLVATEEGSFQILKPEELAHAALPVAPMHEGERVLREILDLVGGESGLLYMEIIRKMVILREQGELAPEPDHVVKRVETDLNDAIAGYRKYVSWGEPEPKVKQQLGNTLGALSADLSDVIERERQSAAREIEVQNEYVRARRIVAEPRLVLPPVGKSMASDIPAPKVLSQPGDA